MEWLKLIHVCCAGLSLSGFIGRGVLMMRESPLLNAHLVKKVPHLVDTLLLISAVTLAVRLRLSPMENPWLLAKIIALLFYIGLGVVALRLNSSKPLRIAAWVVALLVFAYIVAVAVTKSPLPFT